MFNTGLVRGWLLSQIFFQFDSIADNKIWYWYDRESAEEDGGEPEEDQQLGQWRGQHEQHPGPGQHEQGLPQEGDGDGVQG